MQRLDPQGRLVPSLARAAAAALDHVGGGVAPVDVDPGLEPRDEQPPGAAAGVEDRPCVRDASPEVFDLRPLGVEVRPPFGDEPVVPCRRLVHGLNTMKERGPEVT